MNERDKMLAFTKTIQDICKFSSNVEMVQAKFEETIELFRSGAERFYDSCEQKIKTDHENAVRICQDNFERPSETTSTSTSTITTTTDTTSTTTASATTTTTTETYSVESLQLALQRLSVPGDYNEFIEMLHARKEMGRFKLHYRKSSLKEMVDELLAAVNEQLVRIKDAAAEVVSQLREQGRSNSLFIKPDLQAAVHLMTHSKVGLEVSLSEDRMELRVKTLFNPIDTTLSEVNVVGDVSQFTDNVSEDVVNKLWDDLKAEAARLGLAL